MKCNQQHLSESNLKKININ